MLELMDRHVAANTMIDLAAVHVRHGSLRDAITCYERAVEAMREQGDHHGEAQARRALEAARARAAAQEGERRSKARTAS
ncbi:MAG TPA: hypothetical protein VGR11_16650 [Solirubrobacteraceae bacterium]|nr:hypothetical protein [Solirubrobacteraceae bacterium]